MNKDLILKDITKEAIKDILKYILHIETENIEFLNIEFPKIEHKKADILVKANDKIIHLEFQTKNDKQMLYRQLRYFVEIQKIYQEYEIYQYVIYIGKEKLNMNNRLIKHNINYSYDIIDMKQLNCEEFLKIDTPEALVLAILCDFEDERKTIRKILSRLLEITKNENEFKKYILMLEELSTSRNLKDIIKEEEMGLQHLTWEDLPSYEIGLEKGIQKGIQKGMHDGKIESAKVLIKTFNLPVEKVAQQLNIDIEILKKALNG